MEELTLTVMFSIYITRLIYKLKIQFGKFQLEHSSWKIQVGIQYSSWKIQLIQVGKFKLENSSWNTVFKLENSSWNTGEWVGAWS